MNFYIESKRHKEIIGQAVVFSNGSATWFLYKDFITQTGSVKDLKKYKLIPKDNK